MWRIALVGMTGMALLGCGGGESATNLASRGERVIRVSGSDDVYPLVETLARQFENHNAGYRVLFAPPAHSRGGAAAISLGESDVGLLSRPLAAGEKGAGATYLHLAHDFLVVAAHSNVKVDGLGRQQLLDIFSGRITNWKEVGGHDASITVLDLAEHTSAKILLRQQLFGSAFEVTPEAMVLARPDDMITSLAVVENSIGFTSFGNTIFANPDIRYMAIDGFKPTPDDPQRDAYSYGRPFGFLVGPNPSRGTMKFISFMYSEQGRRTIESRGFSPITMDLVIAVQPEQDLLAQEQRYAPFVDYLSRHLGLQTTVTLRLLPDYGAVIEEFREGRINAAVLGSLAFALARAQVGVEPIARPEQEGVSQYRGLIVTRRDSGIRDWTDLEGKSFGFVDRATTAGHLYPLLYFAEHGVRRPEQYLGSIVYTGSHDLLFVKVFEGELDAGAAKDLMLEEVSEHRPEIKEALRILDISPPVPNNTFVLAGDLDFPCFRCHELVPRASPAGSVPRRPEELNRMITELLLNLHESPEGRTVLEALGADRFVGTTIEDLREVNRMIERAGFAPEEYRP